MPILATCHCGKRYHAEDRLAGKEMKCVACGAMFLVPGGGGVSRPVNPPPSRAAASPSERPIPIYCRCGKKFHTSRAFLGKSVSCTKCGCSILVTLKNAGPLIVQCECGERTEVAASLRGKRAKCNACDRILVIDGALKIDLEPPATAAKQIDPNAAGAVRAQCECGKAMSLAADFVGRRVRCPRCHREFRLPKSPDCPSPNSPNTNL